MLLKNIQKMGSIAVRTGRNTSTKHPSASHVKRLHQSTTQSSSIADTRHLGWSDKGKSILGAHGKSLLKQVQASKIVNSSTNLFKAAQAYYKPVNTSPPSINATITKLQGENGFRRFPKGPTVKRLVSKGVLPIINEKLDKETPSLQSTLKEKYSKHRVAPKQPEEFAVRKLASYGILPSFFPHQLRTLEKKFATSLEQAPSDAKKQKRMIERFNLDRPSLRGCLKSSLSV